MPNRLSILFLVALCVCAREAGKAGVLVIFAGDGWSLGARKIASRDRVPAIADLTAANSAGDLLLFCNQAGWLSYSCSGHACKIPVCSTSVDGVKVQHFDPATGAKTSVAADSGESIIASLLKHERKPPAVLGVREGGRLTDAILSKTTAGVHWGPMLQRVLEGTYCFRVTPIPPEGSPPAPVLTFSLNWDRDSDPEGIASQSPLDPGLYSVQKGKPAADGACTLDPDVQGAWVVLTPEADFPSTKAAWTSYSTQLRQAESGGASPDVLLEMRHAILAYLSDSVAKQ